MRSAQKLALSDGVLFRRLCLLVLLYCSYLTAWTAFHPPVVETARTSGDLKYERCVENWFNLTLIFGKTGIILGITYFCKDVYVYVYTGNPQKHSHHLDIRKKINNNAKQTK